MATQSGGLQTATVLGIVPAAQPPAVLAQPGAAPPVVAAAQPMGAAPTPHATVVAAQPVVATAVVGGAPAYAAVAGAPPVAAQAVAYGGPCAPPAGARGQYVYAGARGQYVYRRTAGGGVVVGRVNPNSVVEFEEERYCGVMSCCIASVLILVGFFPIALCVPCCPCDRRRRARPPYPMAHTDGL